MCLNGLCLLAVFVISEGAVPVCFENHSSLLQLDSRRASGKDASGLAESRDPLPQAVELKIASQSTQLMMPLIGLGAAQGPADKLKASIASFLALGGKLIDTAIMYDHRPVGEQLTVSLQNGVLRQNIWITSKILPQAANTSAQTLQLIDQSLSDLGLSYIDLFLIHWPGPTMGEIWNGLIQAKQAGKIRAIGVSNFSPDQISQLEAASGQRPSVNQLQYHPWVGDDVHATVRWCLANGVAPQAWGSLGGQYHQGLANPRVQEVAARHSKSPAQVLLRWALHQGVAVIPGASSPQHIAEDLAVANFELDPSETGLDFFKTAV